MQPEPHTPHSSHDPTGAPSSPVSQLAALAAGDLPDPRAKPYLLGGEVAVLLCAAPKTVATWAKQGKLPYLRTLGGHRRYPTGPILELVKARRRTLVPNPPTIAGHHHTGQRTP